MPLPSSARALVRLALPFGEHADQIVVIGGLNADLLTDAPGAPHQGTVDVDLLIQVGFVFERDETDLGWLEVGLRAAGFSPFPGDEAWRRMRAIDDVPVKAAAVVDRGLDKDLDDRAFVLLHNREGGRADSLG